MLSSGREECCTRNSWIVSAQKYFIFLWNLLCFYLLYFLFASFSMFSYRYITDNRLIVFLMKNWRINSKSTFFISLLVFEISLAFYNFIFYIFIFYILSKRLFSFFFLMVLLSGSPLGFARHTPFVFRQAHAYCISSFVYVLHFAFHSHHFFNRPSFSFLFLLFYVRIVLDPSLPSCSPFILSLLCCNTLLYRTSATP